MEEDHQDKDLGVGRVGARLKLFPLLQGEVDDL